MNCKICQLKPTTIKKLSSDNQKVVKIFMEAKHQYESEIEQLSAEEKKNFLATYADAQGFITMPDGNKVKINFIEEFDTKLCEHLELVAPEAARDWEGYTGEPEPKEVESVAPKKTKAQIEALIKGYSIKFKRTKDPTIQQIIKGYEIALKRAK